jgi:hypothetical protein
VLPDSRNTTYGSGSNVKSADLDDIQDMIVGGKHGEITLPLPGAAGVADANVSRSTVNGGITTTAGATIFYAFPLKKGDRPQSLIYASSGNGSVDFTAIEVVVSNTLADTNSPLGSGTLSNVGALADNTIALAGTAIGADESVFVYFTANAAAAVIRNVRLVVKG